LLLSQFYGSSERDEGELLQYMRATLVAMDIQLISGIEFGSLTVTRHPAIKWNVCRLSDFTLSPDGTMMAVIYSPGYGSQVWLAVYSIDDSVGVYGYADLSSLFKDSGEPDGRYGEVFKSKDLEGVILAFSPDNGYMAVSIPGGAIYVLRIRARRAPKADAGNDEGQGEFQVDVKDPIYSNITPSVVKQMFLSRNAEVLFLRSSRLGGIVLINLETKTEMDVGHYLLNIKVSVDWPAIALNSDYETYVFGCPVPEDPKEYPKGAVWRYLEAAVRPARSESLPVSFPRRLTNPSVIAGTRLPEEPQMNTDANAERLLPLSIIFMFVLDEDRMPTMDEFLSGKDPEQTRVRSPPPPDSDSPEYAHHTLGYVTSDDMWDVSPCRSRLALVTAPTHMLTVHSLSPVLLENHTATDYEPGLTVRIDPAGLRAVRVPRRDRVVLLYDHQVLVYRLSNDGPQTCFKYATIDSAGGLYRMQGGPRFSPRRKLNSEIDFSPVN
jgi:hypothetical protein